MTAPRLPSTVLPRSARPGSRTSSASAGCSWPASRFWTAVGLVFAGQFALMQLGSDRRMPLHQLVVGELTSWVPCALLTPAIVAAALRVRAAGLSLPRVLLLHVIGAALFVAVGGALMGTVENLLPWTPPETALAAAGSGILRYLGPDLLIYCQVVAATEAFAHAWESRRRGIAAATYARQLAEARLHVLSAQLQPHFLFNTLHAISALVYEDPPRAERLLARLSEMLRLDAAERHAGGDHPGGGAGAAPPVRGDPGGALRRAAAGGVRGGAGRSRRDGPAPHPSAAGRERHPARNHPPDHAGPGGRARVGGRRASAPRGVRRRRGTSAHRCARAWVSASPGLGCGSCTERSSGWT